jgi:hypothetical protein
MRGLDPRIHVVAGAASSYCARADGRNNSGHDDLKVRGHHCAFGSVHIGYFPGQPCAKAGIQGGTGRRGCPPVQARGQARNPRFCGVTIARC